MGRHKTEGGEAEAEAQGEVDALADGRHRRDESSRSGIYVGRLEATAPGGGGSRADGGALRGKGVTARPEAEAEHQEGT